MGLKCWTRQQAWPFCKQHGHSLCAWGRLFHGDMLDQTHRLSGLTLHTTDSNVDVAAKESPPAALSLQEWIDSREETPWCRHHINETTTKEC